MNAPRQLRLGVAGLGRAFTLMLPTFASDPRVKLVAATDPRYEACEQFANDFGGRIYGSLEELCADTEVDVVYIATPHQHHAGHVRAAAARGKHVLVEKPMAIALDECHAMIEAADAAGTILIVGHSHSFNGPVLRAREIIARGIYGRPRMIHALNYTDFLYRPRRPDELVTSQGGGVIFSQGAHQIDIVRLLGGGRVKTVRAATGSWDPDRQTESAYSALLTFEDGAFASVTYSGFAHFDSDELTNWIGEMGLPKDKSRHGAARRSLRGLSPADEAALKAARTYGGAQYAPSLLQVAPSRLHQHFGLMIVSCERADLRPQPDGVAIYSDEAVTLDPVPVPNVPRAEVIDELWGAVIDGKRPLHDGRWSMATMEVCLAILASAAQGKEIALKYQVAPGERP